MSVSATGARRERAVGFKLVFFWALVAIPLLWGVARTLGNAAKLFG